MVRELGMSETLGVSTLEGGRQLSYNGLVSGNQAVCSDATLRAVDSEVSRILNEAHERTRSMMARSRAVLRASGAASHRDRVDERRGAAQAHGGDAYLSRGGPPQRKPVLPFIRHSKEKAAH